jgi:TPP-dependent indolepyruvate ferredoxin oxidoreductase alpha subunit
MRPAPRAWRRAGAGRRRPQLPQLDPAARLSEHEFVSAMMPVLNPAGVQDILDMGLLGWAMSRFTGRWVGFKTIAETVESSASVQVDPFALEIVLPADFDAAAGGLNIRWPDPPLDQEMRLHRTRWPRRRPSRAPTASTAS